MKNAAEVLTSVDFNYRDGYTSYSHYNYLRPGPIAWLKRRRFETAIRLARPWLDPTRTSAIDFGCADGFFLPTLAARCWRVTGIDIDPRDCATAERIAEPYPGVHVLCNGGLEIDELREQCMAPHDVLFLLETLEHVGTVEAMYESRVQFLRELFTLLVSDGIVILSVPKMVGPSFLAKHAVQAALGMPHEAIGVGDVLRAGLLRDTERLEPTWFGGHRGFNHLKLERAMRHAFRIVRRTTTLTSAFYVLRATSATR